MKKRYLLELIQPWHVVENKFCDYSYISAKGIKIKDEHSIRPIGSENDAIKMQKTTFTKIGARRVYNKWLKEHKDEHNIVNHENNEWMYIYDIRNSWKNFLTYLSLKM
jgi:hypothetical protein